MTLVFLIYVALFQINIQIIKTNKSYIEVVKAQESFH